MSSPMMMYPLEYNSYGNVVVKVEIFGVHKLFPSSVLFLVDDPIGLWQSVGSALELE